jgi:hypothetical protein
MGVVALAGLGLLGMQNWIPAALCLVAAAVLGAGALIYRQSGEQKGPVMTGPRYGRGPYTAVACAPSAEFVRNLAEMVRELREAATQADMKIDTEGLGIHVDRAAAGNQTGDYAQAVRNYCHAISFLLAEFKRQGKSRPGSSRR